MSIAKASLKMTGLFESELLIELMLRHWKHPLAEEQWFRDQLLENAAEALRSAISGNLLIDGLRPQHMNLVAAAYYVEWSALTQMVDEGSAEVEGRKQWLDSIRRAIPSCFCDPDSLV